MEFFYTPNTDVLASAGITSIKALLMRKQMRWCGHIFRIANERMQKQLFYCELAEEKRYRRKPKKDKRTLVTKDNVMNQEFLNKTGFDGDTFL
ncbi:Hypothetical predicted protein [Octopus vulgaris]|uniref:Uncharacterized protein n=1 Tax=Octopus vulgaris TaxID=6645 RepID=A0AA36AF63_OCTVU|nr:Hypothetical predicted protein [Octopus vulgaris]